MTDADENLTRWQRRAVAQHGAEAPRRDLWPDIQVRLESGRRPLSWVDWAIAAAAAAGIATQPDVVSTVLYLL